MQGDIRTKPLNCYLIPGLGATAAIFDNLELPETVQRIPITWITPESGEPLSEYAQRLLPQINRTEPFIFIGCSFGGIVALELAKHCKPELTVLISSVPACSYIPNAYKSAKWTGAYRLAALGACLPKSLARMPLAWAFGVKNPETIRMLCRQVTEADPRFISWAIAALMKWNHAESSSIDLMHFHGDADRILPLGNMRPDVTIRDGGHLIVYTHGTELGAAVHTRLQHMGLVSNDQF